jgi:tripartite-type tricarboxylate transporter receptor subunit TctC
MNKIKYLSNFAAGATCVAAMSAMAQSYPAKPIRLIVAFAPGGATDTFARITAAEISRSVGQQVVVENRPGAGTTIAADYVAKAPADGYTLLFTDLSTYAIMPSIYHKLAFNHARDLVAVSPVSVSPLLMAAHPSLGARNTKELIALAKKNPGITCGNSGAGTVTHLASEKFRTRAGISLTPVNYKGGATSTMSLLTGELSLIVNTIPASLEHVKSKKLVAIGITADKRAASLPDIAALGETVKGVDAAVIAGVLAPANTPRAVIERLNAEFARAVDAPKAKESFLVNAAEALKQSPEVMQRALERDVQTWAEVVRVTGVKLN